MPGVELSDEEMFGGHHIPINNPSPVLLCLSKASGSPGWVWMESFLGLPYLG